MCLCTEFPGTARALVAVVKLVEQKRELVEAQTSFPVAPEVGHGFKVNGDGMKRWVRSIFIWF